MPQPVNGITGVSGDRSPASADVVAEARQRQAERLRAAQAESEKPTEIVEATAKSDRTAPSQRDAIQPYRVHLDPATRRLYTDVIDMETGEVIMRIPPTYVDPAETPGGVENGTDGAPKPAGRETEA